MNPTTSIQIADQNRSIALPTDLLQKYQGQLTSGGNIDNIRASLLNDVYSQYGLDSTKYSTGKSQGNSTYNENIQNADQTIDFLTNAAAGTVGGISFEAALRNTPFEKTTNQAVEPTPGQTRQPAPTVAGLTPQELAQNQAAEQARGTTGGQSQADILLAQAQQMLTGGAKAGGTPTAQPQSSYTGGSIVDYLNSVGQNSSFNARKSIAEQNGITGYTGSATQNTQLLNALRSRQGTTVNSALTSGQQTASKAQPTTGGAVDAQGNINGVPANPADQYPTSTKSGVGAVDNSPSGVTEVYSKLYKDLGLSDIKTQFEKVMKDQTELTNKINDEKAQINDNPWLTEGERVLRNRKLDEKYATRLDTLTNQQQLYKSFYDDGIQQAQFLTGQIMTEQHNQAVLDAQVQQNAIENAQKALDASAKLDGPASVQEYKYAVSQGYGGSYTDYQNEDANRKISIAKAGVSGSGLTPSQINSTVNSIASAFDNEPLVKEYNTIKRNVDTFNSLGTSATDDIQRVYTFAKVADPNSAVKEGEYASIEKYAQAVLQRVGLKVSRVFNATGILTPEARTAMGSTLNTSLQASQRAYQQVASEYQRQVDDAYSGSPRQITNYSGGTAPTSTTSNGTDWSTDYNYTRDIEQARQAIQQGADKNAVRARLLTKYKEVSL